jgi:DNA end-binding protein Ku
MARAIWSGSITFGLVNIPIKLYTAVREQNIHFNLLHDQDNVRLQQKMICPADGQEVHPEHRVRGYPIGPDQYVIVRQEELDALAPKASRTIEIRDFVDQKEIDPIYYDRPYYVVPQEHAVKAYHLLMEAMRKSKKIGIATFVMRNKEYLSAIRPQGDVLLLETMRYDDEVQPADKLDDMPTAKVDVNDRELKAAQQLIESLETKFKPQQYHNEYYKAVMEMIERKARGEKVVTQPVAEKKPGKTTDLMAALEASLSRVRSETKSKPATKPRTTRRRKSKT